ncbi:hypothetical protein VTN00DRAFT_5907 [Thermoascus crustaceus]|uniref:uncharacterized protein n=1 Tax=Thermoascus crustaceus TaxID=5088 RepID=UPI003742E3E3
MSGATPALMEGGTTQREHAQITDAAVAAGPHAGQRQDGTKKLHRRADWRQHTLGSGGRAGSEAISAIVSSEKQLSSTMTGQCSWALEQNTPVYHIWDEASRPACTSSVHR